MFSTGLKTLVPISLSGYPQLLCLALDSKHWSPSHSPATLSYCVYHWTQNIGPHLTLRLPSVTVFSTGLKTLVSISLSGYPQLLCLALDSKHWSPSHSPATLSYCVYPLLLCLALDSKPSVTVYITGQNIGPHLTLRLPSVTVYITGLKTLVSISLSGYPLLLCLALDSKHWSPSHSPAILSYCV